ncbi:conserved hypothetical protein [Leishmania mexicana MHOM/GT/2001/U1103]|uniref:Uncharacterized protein n=1 Tax=Leishmania mexicana (strain MHOM/GT/2001/U1103) TaxID=929439 RepID=E9AS61_LEIMU|nr:conserved hypothetical protein [Leishmania mexicana MHOM/GT/2001/U1103]CBZ25782.1 conserved hypothetical protein [Leishmania mexicana MHOM/GT/2001/U1103]
MNDYDELYEDDFEDDELASVAAKSVSCRAAFMSTPHRSAPAINGTASKGGAVTSTAVGHRDAAAESGMEPAPQRPMCSLGSSFSSYQSSSADPLLQSAHELCSSSSHSSSTSSSRQHRDPTHPTNDSGKIPSDAGSVKAHRASPNTNGANGVVVASGFVREPTSLSNFGAVTPASARLSAPQTLEQREIASSGAAKAYVKLGSDDGVQVIARMGGEQLRPMSLSEASATETAASSCASFHSTPHASLSPGRAGSSRHGMPSVGSGSASETGAKHPRRVKFVGQASGSSSDSSCSSDDDGGSGCGRLHGTSPPPFAFIAAPPAAAVAPGIEAPAARNVSAERRHSRSGSVTTHSRKKLLHQSNYTSVDVLEADDDRCHRRTPAEIDAEAAPVDDEEEDHDDANASNTMPPMAAVAGQPQRLAPSPSGAHSDSFTSLTPSASARPSPTSHQAPSLHTTTTAPSSSIAQTTRSSSNRAPLQSGPDSVGAHRNSRPNNSVSAVALQASSSNASPSRPALSEASPKTRATSGTAFRGAIHPRQVTTVCNDTMDARRFDGVYDSKRSCDDSGEVDTDEDHMEKPQKDARSSKQLSSPPLPPSRTSRLSTTTFEDACLSKVGTAKTKGRTNTSTTVAKDGDAPESGERAALLARVAQLREEMATWDRRIARQHALMGAEAGRSDGAAVSSSKCRSADGTGVARSRRGANGGKRRSDSMEQALHTQADAKGDGRPANARLTKLRRENEQLEAQYARQGAGGAEMNVQVLVVRADTQLQKARLRLKEVTAVRRALEHRDKRAAHTIKEVHRRMPTTDELEERQHNEGIYSLKGLLRTVKELKENLERTRAATKMMKAKCAELEAHVRRKHLSSIVPKEYEALCATRDANVKAIEKHKTAISVYTLAFAHELRKASKVACGSDTGVCGTQSSHSSCTTSPFSPAITPTRTESTVKEQQQVIAEYEANKADLLLQQKRTLMYRKQELQASIDKLWQRVQKYNEQIKTNHAQAGLSYFDVNSAAAANPGAPLYAVGGSDPTCSTPATTSAVSARDGSVLVAGSGAVAARKRSLRDVLLSPMKCRIEADAKARCGAATKSLCGGVAAALKGTPENANGNAKHSNLGFKALPALVQAGKRTARAEHRASLPAVKAVLDLPVKGPVQISSSMAADGEMPTSSRDDIEEEVDDHDSIEAVLRKIDADNKRLGHDVFGLEGIERAAPPAFLHSLYDANAVRAADNVPGDGDGFEEESVPHKVKGDSGGYAGGAGHHDHATSAAERLHEVYDRAVLAEPPTEEEEVEAELSAGKSDESGRSTPEWLRDD